MGIRFSTATLLRGLILAVCLLAAGQARAESLVPAAESISDQQAMLFLAEFNWRTGKFPQAAKLLALLDQKAGHDPRLLLEMASLQARMGHAAESRSLFARALPLAKDRDAANLAQARAMNLWGDFYRMEAIYREHLKQKPNDFAVKLDLARLFMACQRFEKAEAAFLALLRDDPSREQTIREGLCELKWQEGDLAGCLKRCQELLRRHPSDPVALDLAGRANLRQGKLEPAAFAFAVLAEIPGQEAKGWTGLGRVRQKQGRDEDALGCYEKAASRQGPQPEAEFLLMGKEFATAPKFVAALTAPGFLPPAGLTAWAEIYRRRGHSDQAAACYRAALAADPAYFPARLALAETYGTARRFEEANRMLAQLAGEFAGASKVMLTRARVLAWSKHYHEALKVYLAMHRLNPADKVPIIEAARTAAWAKDMGLSRKYYAMLWQTPVSERLRKRLGQMPGLPSEMADLARTGSQGEDPPYKLYEDFQKLLQKGLPGTHPALLHRLEKLAEELKPAYRVQKSAYLELAGKEALYHNRPLEALDSYDALAGHQPGNQEAVFDLGQAQCSLGLYDREQKTYTGLLALDPLHGRAGAALFRAGLKNNPLAGLGYSAWSEDGRGEAARITRHRADAGVEFPLWSRLGLALTAHQWWEQPHRWGGEQEASGFTLEAGGRITPYLEARGAWTRKSFQGDQLRDQDLGLARLGIRLRDYAVLTIGWQKEDVVKNAFSLRQQTTRQNWRLSVDPNLGRDWGLNLAASFMDYSDDNQGLWAGFKLSRLLSDHPSSLKLVLLVDYRDYRHETREIYQGDRLIDMQYPYWTPRDWLGANLALVWRRDYSQLYICGGETRYYELSIATGTDTEGNAMAALEAAWHHEFAQRWAVDLRGLVHRSREWDAQGFWLNLSYRF